MEQKQNPEVDVANELQAIISVKLRQHYGVENPHWLLVSQDSVERKNESASISGMVIGGGTTASMVALVRQLHKQVVHRVVETILGDVKKGDGSRSNSAVELVREALTQRVGDAITRDDGTVTSIYDYSSTK